MPGPESRDRLALRAFDYIFLLRPAVLVPLWVFFVAGARLGAREAGIDLPLFWPTREVLLGLGSMTALLGGAYLLNQIRDIETDRHNDKLFFLPRGIISVRAAWCELAVVWLLAGALAVPLSGGFRWILVCALALAVTYSAPPVTAKAHAPLDLVWNALGFGATAVAAGWATVAPLSAVLIAHCLAYALAVAGVTASTTILDRAGDQSAGLRTTAVVLGDSRASLLAVFLLVAAAAAGAVLRDPLAVFGPILSLPLLVRAHIRRGRAERVLGNQVAVAVFAVVVGVGSIYLLALLALVYFGSRIYYRRRFGVSYPGGGTP